MDSGEGPGAQEHGEWVLNVADQLANTQLPARGSERPKRRGVLAAGAAVLVIAGVLGAVVVFGGDDDTVDTAGSPASTSTTAPPATLPSLTESSAAPAETAVPAATETPTTSAATTVVPAAVEVATTAAAEPSTTAPSDPNAPPVRWAEFSGGIVYLRGLVPDQATADEVAAKAGAVVGPDNVRVEYTIDPAAPRPDSAPLYVNDAILFEPGFAVLDQAARDTLDLGASLLTLYPQVTFDIEGHTDDQGTEADNLALSQRRVDVIVAYLTDRGIDPTRLTAVAKGESEPIADNATPEGRAKNRRIEISVNNLLG